MNKEEFVDSIRLRYGWHIPNTASECGCGKRNNLNHALSCKKGGYIIYRHDRVRDENGKFLRQVCQDVQIEPGLLPIKANKFESSGNTSDSSRLDIAARGLWGPFQRTLFDVRIFHPNCDSYRSSDITDLYKLHENQKIREYGNRVAQIEKASFTPLVYSTHGGMSIQAERFYKRLAKLISEKRKESYDDVIRHLRTKIRFTLLKSVLVSLRGVRGRHHQRQETPLSFVEFGLIPEMKS